MGAEFPLPHSIQFLQPQIWVLAPPSSFHLMRIPRVRFLFFNTGEMGPTAPSLCAAWNTFHTRSWVLGCNPNPTSSPRLFIPSLVPGKHLYLLCINKYIIYECLCACVCVRLRACVRACELPRLLWSSKLAGIGVRLSGSPYPNGHFLFLLSWPSGYWRQSLYLFSVCFALTTSNVSSFSLASICR